MNAIMRSIDRFCYKHPRFGINRLMLYMVIGNAIVFVFSMMDRTGTFLSYLYLNVGLVLRGQVWRLVTFLFVPLSSNLLFEALALYFYYFIGNTLENHWGAGRFTIFYFSGALFTLLYGIAVSLITGRSVMLSADYLNLSMFFAFAALYPDMRVYIMFILPVKIKWLAIADAVLFALSVIVNPFPENLLPVIALLNFVIFFGQQFIDMLRRRGAGRTARQSMRFQAAVHNAKREASEKPYRHKCAVCGRTDTDYPNLEFRYCSRCQGYHCFCIDHINNHVHFTE